MLEELLRHLHNWFLVDGGVHEGTFTIQDGNIALPFLQERQYFRIVGSVFNDGVYQYNIDMGLEDETFNGQIWALAVPKGVVEISKEIEAWQEKNGAAAASPYVSESFGGYSYTKSTAGSESVSSWQDAFRSRLTEWRKL